MSQRRVEARFEALYASNVAAILGYASRRTSTSDDAADVVAETFTIAWRRIGDVPTGDQARLWLYGVARRTLLNHRRGAGRQGRLADRLKADLEAHHNRAHHTVSSPDPVLEEAFRALRGSEREVLALSVWEGLSTGELAAVLGCTENAAKLRLSRARRRLRADLTARQHPSIRERHLSAASPTSEGSG
jgi:RNA polymerase sigma-70 factor (ECF subfamily)